VHSLDGFYKDMADKGLFPTAEVLEQKLEPATPKIATFLQLEPKTPVIKLTRLRYVGEEAIVLVTSYLPYERCQDLIEADLTNQSLYAFLEDRYGYTIARGKRRIDATVANEVEAELFQIEKGSPLMRLESVSYLQDGTAIEYFDAFFRGDRSRFEVEIIGIQGQGKLAEVLGEPSNQQWFV
jgi:GntR family transcriptional regulator